MKVYRYPMNWRDWRFGFVIRKYAREVDVGLGPLAFSITRRAK